MQSAPIIGVTNQAAPDHVLSRNTPRKTSLCKGPATGGATSNPPETEKIPLPVFVPKTSHRGLRHRYFWVFPLASVSIYLGFATARVRISLARANLLRAGTKDLGLFGISG